MAKHRKEARSERVNVSLKPATLEVLQRLSIASGVPVPTIISEYVESCEGVFRAGAAVAERARAVRDKAAAQQEKALLRQAGSKS